MKSILSKIVFAAVIVLSLFGVLSSPLALLCGVLFAIVFDHPFLSHSRKGIHHLLKISVIGLGFGMQIKETLKTGEEGLGLTIFTISMTVGLGLLLAKWWHLDKKVSHLITSGTSICGGSAIAAVSPVIKAESHAISVALGVVFMLNSIALFVFPVLGHQFHLSQSQFGMWCAVAIHDTSSVVGAALGYGDEALRIATTVKLTRTLWIIPMSIFSMLLFKTKGEKIKIPYFILGFLVAILIHSYNLIPESLAQYTVIGAKRALVVTLFLVGSTLSIKQLKEVGWKPIAFAVVLWLFISAASLMWIMA